MITDWLDATAIADDRALAAKSEELLWEVHWLQAAAPKVLRAIAALQNVPFFTESDYRAEFLRIWLACRTALGEGGSDA